MIVATAQWHPLVPGGPRVCTGRLLLRVEFVLKGDQDLLLRELKFQVLDACLGLVCHQAELFFSCFRSPLRLLQFALRLSEPRFRVS